MGRFYGSEDIISYLIKQGVSSQLLQAFTDPAIVTF
jgi:hypothetical protein